MGVENLIELKCLKTAHDRHREIEQCQIKAGMLKCIKRGFAIVDNCYAMTATFKNELGDTLVGWIVFRDENSGPANLCNICRLL